MDRTSSIRTLSNVRTVILCTPDRFFFFFFPRFFLVVFVCGLLSARERRIFSIPSSTRRKSAPGLESGGEKKYCDVTDDAVGVSDAFSWSPSLVYLRSTTAGERKSSNRMRVCLLRLRKSANTSTGDSGGEEEKDPLLALFIVADDCHGSSLEGGRVSVPCDVETDWSDVPLRPSFLLCLDSCLRFFPYIFFCLVMRCCCEEGSSVVCVCAFVVVPHVVVVYVYIIYMYSRIEYSSSKYTYSRRTSNNAETRRADEARGGIRTNSNSDRWCWLWWCMLCTGSSIPTVCVCVCNYYRRSYLAIHSSRSMNT